ncbi:MAG: patatin family protein [Candidatus Sericytochromatia bacterium]
MKALILEGGAMRSVHSAGALKAFGEMGYSHDYFDFVFGASAGACNAAYFLAGQTNEFWKMWSDTLLSKDFVNVKNILSRKKPVLNVDFAIEEVMLKRHPVNVKKILESNTKFYVIATNCSTGQAEYFLNDKEETFFDVIKASSSIPILYNKSVKIDGIEYMDGALSDSIPIKKAIELGAKEIYVLLTRHDGYRKRKTLADSLSATIYKKYPKIRDSILNRHIEYNECLEVIENQKEGIEINIIRPRYDLGISRTTSDPSKLKSGFLIGYYDALKILKIKNQEHKIVC